MVPWAYPSLHPKWHIDRFSSFCTAHRRVSHYFKMGRYVFPKKLPLSLGASGLPSNTWYLRPNRVTSQTASRSVQPFLYESQMLCYTMHCQWGRKYIPQNCPFTLQYFVTAPADEVKKRNDTIFSHSTTVDCNGWHSRIWSLTKHDSQTIETCRILPFVQFLEFTLVMT